MKITAIVPVKTFVDSKKRLSTILSVEERIRLSEAMLHDVLESVSNSASIDRILVVSGDSNVLPIAGRFGAAFLHEERERGVNAAVALADRLCADPGTEATVVIPQDLPLMLPSDIEMLCSSASEKRCVLVTPSHRYDGTNALLRRPPGIMETHYDEDSYEIHVQKAREKKAAVKIVLNRRLMLDLDEPADMQQILAANAENRTMSCLRELRHKLGRIS